MSANEFLSASPPQVRAVVATIREEKQRGVRRKPSSSLQDNSTLLTPTLRTELLNQVASMVDENLCGRSEMCIQFAILLAMALRELGLPAKEVVGKAFYYVNGRKIFDWNHVWVRIGGEVIDGNVDILDENPFVPKVVVIRPYWGPIDQTPSDRKLRADIGAPIPADTDVENIWWPELKIWLKARNNT